MSIAMRITKIAEHARLNSAVAASATVAAVLGVAILPRLCRGYKTWYNLGPAGAFPHNIFGWIAQGLILPIAHSDPLSLKLFKQPKVVKEYREAGQRSFLLGSSLPRRNGDRPPVPAGFIVVPQRQIDQKADAEMIQRMEAYLKMLAQENPELLKLESSRLEGVGNPALFLAEGKSNHLIGGGMQGEIIHRHSEGSSHLVLSLFDAEEAVRKGWSQKFRLSNVFLVPATYVMVYAPRNEEEFKVWKSLVLASARFVLAHESAEVREVGA